MAMQSFMSQFSLKTILPDDKATFHHNHQVSESQIDHILYFIPESHTNLKIQFSDHFCKKENSYNLSSHDVIVGQINLPTEPNAEEEEDFSKSYSDFIRRKPKWNYDGIDGYQNETAEVLSEMMSNFDEPFFIPVLCEMFSKTLVISAEHNFECSTEEETKY